MRKVRKLLGSMLSILLAVSMVAEVMPVQALAVTRQDVYLDEIEIPQEVLDGDFFYLGNTSLSIPENGDGRYLFKVARGGDASGESTALVKIADLTARFGEDYVVSVHDGTEKVDNPEDNYSLIELMESSEYTQSELADEETAAEAIKNDEEGMEAYNDGVNAALEYIASESGLDEKYPDGYPVSSEDAESDSIIPDSVDGSLDAQEPETAVDKEAIDGPDTDAGDIADDPASEDEDIDLNGVTVEDGSETVGVGDKASPDDALQQARSTFTGVEGTSQRLSSEASDEQVYKDLQSVANVMTNAVVGASVELAFKEGEKEKYLEIIPKNNVRGDGNRLFYLILAAPSGSTTNSKISTCAVTIVDDEESEPAVVSFDKEVYVHEPGTDKVKVTVVREGSINKVASVRVTTTGEGSALKGRDYSQVDRTLFFPFGIDSLDVEIPVRTAFFNGEKDFFLELTPVGGCIAELGSARVTIEGTYGDGSTLEEQLKDESFSNDRAGSGEAAGDIISDNEEFAPDGAAQVNTLSTVRTLPAITISNPLYYGNTDNYFNGDNRYDSNRGGWNLMWGSEKRWQDTWTTHKGSVGVTYRLSDDDKPYWLSGARIKWETGSHKHAEIRTEISGSLNKWYKEFGIRPQDKDYYVYNRKSTFGPDIDDIYPSPLDSRSSSASRPLYVHFSNHGECSDCTNLWIYKIMPILRPFQFNYVEDTSLKFLTEDGKQEADDGSAEDAFIKGGADGQLVLFLDEGITIGQDDDSKTQKYASISGLEISYDKDHWYDLNVTSTDNKSVSYRLTEDNIKDFVGRMGEENFYSACRENKFITPFSEYARVKPTYACLYVRPKFEKIPVSVKINNPYDYPVTMTISGKDYDIEAKGSRDVTYYRGDILKTSLKLSGATADNYTASAVHIKYKTDKSETSFKEDDKLIVSGEPIYISGTKDNRLNFDDVTIEPRLQAKDNKIVVRVKTSDIPKLINHDEDGKPSGFMTRKGTVNGDYTDFVFADTNQTLYGKLYPITAEPADDKTVAIWKDENTGKTYEGNTLYFTAGASADKNVVTLCAAQKKYDLRLTGTLYYMFYDLKTLNAGSVSSAPAGGALVMAASGSATADEDGKFRTSAIPVNGAKGDHLRYMVSVNGKPVIKEIALNGSKEIDVTDAFNDGVNPVASDIFSGIQIKGEYGETSDYHVEDGDYLPIVDSEEVSFTVRIKPSEYKASTYDKDGAVKEESKTETPKKVQLLIYGGDNDKRNKGKLKGKYDVVTGKYDEYGGYYEFKSTVYFAKEADTEEKESEEEWNGSFAALPGDMLYIRLTTDRVEIDDGKGGEYDYTYSDLYTGYTFKAPSSYQPPIEQGIDSPVNITYGSADLPFISDTGMSLDFPFGTVGYARTDRGYRLYIGVAPLQVVDALKKDSHMTKFKGDDGKYWTDQWTIKKPVETFKKGFEECWKRVFVENDYVAKALEGGAVDIGYLGNPAWKFDIKLGMYFDFAMPEAYVEGGGSVECPDYIFTGIGAYVAVSLGFKQNWYFILPVVFIPIYIGIELSGDVMGFLGATTSGEATIKYNDTKERQVDFNSALDKFSGTVQGTAMVRVNAGVGLEGTIGVRAHGEVDTIASYQPSDIVRDWGVYITLKAGITADLFLTSIGHAWEIPGTQAKFGAFEDYEHVGEKPVQTLTADTLTADDVGIEASSGGFKLRKGSGMDSAWLAGSSDFLPDKGAFAPDAERTSILDENTYEHPESKLITLQDGTVVLGFIDGDNAKGEYQRTTFKLAVYKNGRWSDPVPVAVDDTADFHPSICEMKDGRVMAAWVSTASADIDENTGTIGYLESMEVYTAIATIAGDGSISMSEPVKITNDRRKKTVDGVEKEVGYYDSNPTVICDMVSGDAVVYYIKAGRTTTNELELASPYTNDCVICYMPYSYEGVEVNGKTEHWMFDYFYDGEVSGGKEAEQTLIDDWGGQRFLDSPTFKGEDGRTEYYQIPDFTAIAYNGQGVYAYSVDHDSNLDTNEDKEIFLQVYDFKTHHTKHRIRLTDDNIADTRPKLFRSKMLSSGDGKVDDLTDTKLFWYRDNNEVCFINVSELLRHGIDKDGNLIPSESEGKSECRYAVPRYITIPSKDSHAQKQMADFTVTEDDKGSLYILWTENEGEGHEIYAISLLTSGEAQEDGDNMKGTGWSAPYQLTKDGYFHDELAVTLSGEDLMVVSNRFKQDLNYKADGTIDEEEPISISSLDLVATVLEPCGAVLGEDITMSYPVTGEETAMPVALPIGGRKVDIDVDLINGGLTEARGFKTTLYATDKSGSATEIGTKTGSGALMPGERTKVTFNGYTLPEDVDGLSFKAVTYELKEGTTYYDNDHEFVTEPLEVRGDFAFDNIVTYQLPDGFHIAGNVTNKGNGNALESDLINVTLNGPYNMDLEYDEADCILGTIGLAGLAPGETLSFDEPVNITADMMKEYGYITASVAVNRPTKDAVDMTDITRVLGDRESVDFDMTMPIGFKALPVSVAAGDNVKPTATDSLGTEYGAGDVIFSINETDSEVAMVQDGRIYGISDGVATLNALHTGSGAVATAKVIVGGGIASEDIPDDDIPDGLWYVIVDGNGNKCDEFTYTGKAIKPEVHVYDGVKRLEESKDYTVSYKNNKNAYAIKEGAEGFSADNAPAVIIKGKGNYSSKDVLYFMIRPIDLYEDPDVYADDMFVKHTGKDLSPVPVVTFGGKKLKKGTDYEVAYYKKDTTDALTSIKDAGTYDLVITGKGNFAGSRAVSVVVGDDKKIKPVSNLKVDKIVAVNYTGSQITPEIRVRDGKKELVSNRSDKYSETGYDYSVRYYNNINAGTGCAVITGNPENGYAGSRRIVFKINGRSLKGAKITGILKKGYEFNGGAVTLTDKLLDGTIKVTAKDGTPLKLYTGKGEPDDRSYTVSYSNNKKTGNATAELKGIGGCTDSVKVKFKITKASLASASAEAYAEEEAPYSKAGSKAAVTVKYGGRKLIEGRDYTVSYKNNKKTGDTATAIVKGKGSFKDTYKDELNFKVVSRDISGLDISAPDVIFKDKAGNFKTKVAITDGGKKLKAGKDYANPVYAYAGDGDGYKAGDPIADNAVLPAGTEVRVTAEASGDNYTGSISTTFRVVRSDIGKVKLKGKIDVKEYTGREVMLTESDIPLEVPATVDKDGVTVRNWEIVEGSYKNNVKKGTASVMIRGLGDYGNTRIIKFRIGTKGFKWFKK